VSSFVETKKYSPGTTLKSWLELTCPLLIAASLDTFCLVAPQLEEVRGGVKPWLMARWKARVEFLLSVIRLRPWGISDSANCTMLRAVVLTDLNAPVW